MAKRGTNVVEASAGRVWNYTPVMQFFRRMIETAMIEALAVHDVPCPYGSDYALMEPLSVPTQRWDEAIMGRAWIAREAPDGHKDRDGYTVSFDHCCEALGLNADAERVTLLAQIDAAADFDTDEVWARIDYLTANPPDEIEEPLFDAPRVCFELDQGNLFAAMGVAA